MTIGNILLDEEVIRQLEFRKEIVVLRGIHVLQTKRFFHLQETINDIDQTPVLSSIRRGEIDGIHQAERDIRINEAGIIVERVRQHRGLDEFVDEEKQIDKKSKSRTSRNEKPKQATLRAAGLG